MIKREKKYFHDLAVSFLMLHRKKGWIVPNGCVHIGIAVCDSEANGPCPQVLSQREIRKDPEEPFTDIRSSCK